MSVINLLSPHVADLIAAGEVVERPGSVVKELVENAIDAGARNITVEIERGGMGSIRVSDDGRGMSPEDAGLAFLRHATSKLSDERGLEAISTLGFRGEALAAISAVSRVTLLTREKGADTGTRVTLTAGEIDGMEPAGCREGTDMTVRELFYNTPARLKFMKSDRAEGGECMLAALRCALGHPEISVRAVKDGQEQFFSPGDGQMKSAVYSLLGRETAMSMLACRGESDGIRVEGFVSAPYAGRGNRAMQFFYLNGRHFRSATLQAALERAYDNTLLSGRFPTCVLYLTLSYGKVDVNVHPAKREVKFTEEKLVFDALYRAVRCALEEKAERRTAEIRLSPGTQKVAGTAPRPDFYQTMTAAQFRERQSAPDTRKPSPPPAPAQTRLTLRQEAAPHETGGLVPRPEIARELPKAPPPEEPAPPGETPAFRVVGEALGAYIVAEAGDELLLIDKHACHERINFDRLKAGLGPEMSQTLLTPLTWSPGADAAELIEQNAPLLAELGFEAERFGDDGVLVRAVPAGLTGSEPAALEEVLEALRTGRPGDRRDAICRAVACRAAIKAGSRSDLSELEALAARVISGEVRYCPHGRPVSVKLTRAELDKQFKRIV